jgi:hypothetical protein
LARWFGLGYSLPMTDQPDLQRLAARYLDLWQEQVARMATDPALPDLMAKSYGMIKERWDEAAQHFQRGGDDKQPNSAPGSKASAVPSGDPGDQLAVLLERLAAVEDRLGKLEQAAGDGGKRAEGADKPRRSRKTQPGAV